MTEPLQVVPILLRAQSDDSLKATIAECTAAGIREALSSDHSRKPGMLRGSDMGGCVRQVWADVHGKLDIPEDPDALLKMRAGTMVGAHLGATLLAGLAAGVVLEPEVRYRNVVCHTDIAVPRQSIEVKTVFVPFDMGRPEEPNKSGETKDYYVLQSVINAAAVENEHASVLVALPALFAGKGDRLRQYDYRTDEWLSRVDAEIERLTPALGDSMPEGDPQQRWRCSTCRMGACPKNVNPLREIAA